MEFIKSAPPTAGESRTILKELTKPFSCSLGGSIFEFREDDQPLLNNFLEIVEDSFDTCLKLIETIL